MLKIRGLKVDNLSNAIIIDQQRPKISYYIESDQKNAKIVDGIIKVGDWSMHAIDNVAVAYDGPKLSPFSVYEVSVEIKDTRGQIAKASTSFTTGRLHQSWDAKWITDGSYKYPGKKKSPKTMTFRKRFGNGKSIKSAMIYATALGIYELNLNGQKVGNDYFAPGFTAYKHHIQYQVYDVTKALKESNELHAIVGGGWAIGPFTYVRRTKVFAKKQAFLCEIRIVYSDKTVEVIGTDTTWDVTLEGKYVETEFYDGEVYDATVNMDKVKFYKASLARITINPQFRATYGAMVKHMDTIQPIGHHISSKGTLIYDFGQNFAGVIAIKAKATKGQKIVFKHAEILMAGELYTEPLRSAKQEIVYIAKEGVQTYSPKMTFMGFRYVSVEGIDSKDLEIEGYVLYSDIETTGYFECSNPSLNQLQKNIVWSAKSNFIDIPTDCPQRDERMGWTGDIALFASTAAFNFDTSRFLDKWLIDVKAEQRRGGGIPVTVPLIRVPRQYEIALPMAVDHWGDACVLVPWAEYLTRGDYHLLSMMYPVMKRYIEACQFWARLFSFGKHRKIWKLGHHYGDWVAPNSNLMQWMSRGKWTGTASLAHTSSIVSQIASILGFEKDSKYYKKLSEETAIAYRKILMQPNCSLKKEFQTGYVLPLHYRMLSDKDRFRTADHLARMIRENDYKIATGFPGTPYVLFALADNGHLDDAYKMLLNDKAPSWLFMLKAGATTVWEKWDALREDGTSNTGEGDGLKCMVSFNHYANGAVGDFFYKRIAGIEPLTGGYQTFEVKPRLGGDITWSKASVLTAYGPIKSHWEIENEVFSISVEVPVGTRCELVLPSGKKESLYNGSYTLSEKLLDGKSL